MGDILLSIIIFVACVYLIILLQKKIVKRVNKLPEDTPRNKYGLAFLFVDSGTGRHFYLKFWDEASKEWIYKMYEGIDHDVFDWNNAEYLPKYARYLFTGREVKQETADLYKNIDQLHEHNRNMFERTEKSIKKWNERINNIHINIKKFT